MKDTDLELMHVIFNTVPDIRPRNTNKKMTKDELKSISAFPWLSVAPVSFSVVFKFKGVIHSVEETIFAGYAFNYADIPWLLEPLFYDKHDPQVKDASLIHDYVLQFKEALYQKWKLSAIGMNHSDFRKLSSMIFEFIIIEDGVPVKKAAKMTQGMDFYQKLFCWSWFKCK